MLTSIFCNPQGSVTQGFQKDIFFNNPQLVNYSATWLRTSCQRWPQCCVLILRTSGSGVTLIVHFFVCSAACGRTHPIPSTLGSTLIPIPSAHAACQVLVFAFLLLLICCFCWFCFCCFCCFCCFRGGNKKWRWAKKKQTFLGPKVFFFFADLQASTANNGDSQKKKNLTKTRRWA